MDGTQEKKVNDTPQKNENSQWTPELVIQVIKESVTGLLGISIVVCTLILVEQVSDHIGDANKLNQAKDILLIVNLSAGVVLGYYFGRVPADARAATAQRDAKAADKNAQQIENVAQKKGGEVDEIARKLDKMPATVQSGGENTDYDKILADLKKVSDELRQVSTMR